ncbi:uncharacterized protein FOMMEDRAFT_162905 [Fomitiporia mediterranea MF3/22]|uniref:Uncharacterized protein n=1 Tax=Fomitiporia mediterranea (strain MF3/22) TaxID=694068 RepID=R7SIW0_FOMME|nr:uncharacterized protein FOMMEDRAFT_162905 [Fomitiporia mediterranea MF3/22]EJC97549.1 hypothetical protein FOMMEDRAFT_162905 [Fomitiporia mediterranea MF3/22]
MFISTILRPAVIALLALASVTSVSAVCGTNSIGLANAQAGAVIVDNSCNVLTAKSIGDFNVCGPYQDGSQVVCRTPETPSTAHTADGRDWGNCIRSSEVCQVGHSEPPIVQWCCPEL